MTFTPAERERIAERAREAIHADRWYEFASHAREDVLLLLQALAAAVAERERLESVVEEISDISNRRGAEVALLRPFVSAASRIGLIPGGPLHAALQNYRAWQRTQGDRT